MFICWNGGGLFNEMCLIICLKLISLKKMGMVMVFYVFIDGI